MLRITVIVGGNGAGDQSSNPRWNCVSLCAKPLKKGMNPSVLFPGKCE